MIVSSSTAGEIHNSAIYDNTAVATCIKFVKGSSVVGKKVNVLNYENITSITFNILPGVYVDATLNFKT